MSTHCRRSPETTAGSEVLLHADVAAIHAARAEGYRQGLEAARQCVLDRAEFGSKSFSQDYCLQKAAAAIARLKEIP